MIVEPQLFRRDLPGNVFQIVRIALPLIFASAGHSINLFLDRAMLQHYSVDAMSASFPAGLTSFSLSCFFVGTVAYANSFVAQYIGAKQDHNVGGAVWHAIYMALLGGLFMASTFFIAPWLFDFFDHEPHIRDMEVSYFQILGVGGVIPLLNIAFSTFWGGRGATAMIMTVNLIITACNIPFNYLLIFGCDFGPIHIPSMGVDGAAYGTVAAGFVGLVIMIVAFFGFKENRSRFHSCSTVFRRDLFLRMFEYGGPNGLQLFLDLAAFNAFVVLLGRISKDVLNASGVAFSLNSLAMIPMFGLGQTVSILVAQGIGAKDIPSAERAVKSARLLLYSVIFLIGMLFVFYPYPALTLFGLQPGKNDFDLARTMLYFIAAYLIFDATFILYGSAIKGAGDTKFSMWVGASFAWIFYGLPCLLVFHIFTHKSVVARLGDELAQSLNIWTLWTICVCYIMIMGVVFYLRYRSGKWKHMKVIQDEFNDHPRGAIPKETGVDAFLP